MKYVNFLLSTALVASLVFGTRYTFQSYEAIQGLNAPGDYGWAAPEPTEQLLGQEPVQVPSGKGKIRLLYEDWQKATGYAYRSRRQNAPDCVAQSVATGGDIRMAVQAVNGLYKVPEYTVSAPPIYGLSRIEIGGKPPISSPGSHVRWAMRAMEEYGFLFRKNYLYAGYNLTEYDPSKSRTWGSQGLPSVLEQIAKITPVVGYYKVNNYTEVRDAIVNGYPVVVGSDVGFSRRTIFSWGTTKATRDKDGFLRPGGVWNHSMCYVGVDDKSYRKGVCCQNSWGTSWVSGPTKLGSPPGSFWIDARTVTDMASQNDAFAIVHINSPLNYRLTK